MSSAIETETRDLADRASIARLSVTFAESASTGDVARLVSLFTDDGILRIPEAGVELVGAEQIRRGAGRLQENWHSFLQIAHPGSVIVGGDSARGDCPIEEIGRTRAGILLHDFGVYHDRFERTPFGWKFRERAFEMRYLLTETEIDITELQL